MTPGSQPVWLQGGQSARHRSVFCLICAQCGRLTSPHTESSPLNSYLALGVVACFIILVLLAGGAVLVLRKRQNRRGMSIRRLLDLADRLEADLKTCRSGLQQAHAVMSFNPDLPASSEKDAHHAVDAGLRALLQQRLWIRDRAAGASQDELDQAATSMRDARARLQPLLQALNQAQTDLDSAMREQIRREADS